jgi:hydroxylamine reductase
MFCYQCEQTSDSTACTVNGACGKEPENAALQDLLVHATMGIAQYVHRARQLDASDRAIDVFILEALFTTVTNVNFDTDRVAAMVLDAAAKRDAAKAMYEKAAADKGQTAEILDGPATFTPAENTEDLIKQGIKVSIEARLEGIGNDLTGLQELVMYGLKGAAAYADHAQVLGSEDDSVYAGFAELLNYLAGNPGDAGDLTAKALQVGELNLKVMALLDGGNTGNYGHPEPTQVRITPVKGKAILVSGHDLKDLEILLKQTEGKGVNIYTHGEMLPALAYPEFKKHAHLVGHYGGAWQDQVDEFEAFPGSILMTTNCIIMPDEEYKARIFTTGMTAWPGVVHVADKDFSAVIAAALEEPGFEEDGPETFITTGFAHNTVMSVAPTVIEAVKSGAIKRFFLIGGCDGAKPGRNYFTELAEKVPEDCVILTLGCGKFRFNTKEFGDIGGIPRLLDMGQCNDAYSAIQVAVALAGAFDCGVNDLPLSMMVSWFEQKAVAVLLTLLHLGVQNVHLGPTLPAFVTPAVLDVLVENFAIKPTGDVDADLQAVFA